MQILVSISNYTRSNVRLCSVQDQYILVQTSIQNHLSLCTRSIEPPPTLGRTFLPVELRLSSTSYTSIYIITYFGIYDDGEDARGSCFGLGIVVVCLVLFLTDPAPRNVKHQPSVYLLMKRTPASAIRRRCIRPQRRCK